MTTHTNFHWSFQHMPSASFRSPAQHLLRLGTELYSAWPAGANDNERSSRTKNRPFIPHCAWKRSNLTRRWMRLQFLCWHGQWLETQNCQERGGGLKSASAHILGLLSFPSLKGQLQLPESFPTVMEVASDSPFVSDVLIYSFTWNANPPHFTPALLRLSLPNILYTPSHFHIDSRKWTEIISFPQWTI